MTPRDDVSRARIWTMPIAAMAVFVILSAFALHTVQKEIAEEYLEDGIYNVKALEVAFLDVIRHGTDDYTSLQHRVDDLIATNPRVVRLSFITRGRDGTLRHVASSMRARVGKEAHPEDYQAMRENRTVILEETFAGRDCIDITWPVRGPDGAPVGLIGYTMVEEDTYWAPWVIALAALAVVALLSFHFRWVQLTFEQEIAQRRRAEARMREAVIEAERAGRLKDAFLANVSHEIRTPLNGIMGMARLLLQADLGPEERRQARMILNSGERLLTVINDILDFSKIEAGVMKLVPTVFNLRRELREIVHPLELRAREKGLGFELEIAPAVPEWVRADPGRLAQVINNLVGNAVKYTEEGRVRLGVFPAGGGTVLFEVSDTGPGIAERDRERIFDPFVQAGGVRSGESGTGLGLSVAKKVASLMGGDIRLAETGPQGSKFCFTARLPAADPPAAGEEKNDDLAAADIAACHILMAEDEPINRAVVEGYLKDTGWRLTMTDNGAQAVEAFARERFDIVLMDVTMPVMDGFEATAGIRELENKENRPRTPVIAMTAHAVSGYRERCLAAGMDDYLTKPFSREELLAAVARHARTCG